jgi:hypothetical protein
MWKSDGGAMPVELTGSFTQTTQGRVTQALLQMSPNSDTSSMTLKTGAFLAFVGTILLAVLLVWNLFVDIVSAARGLIPAVRIFSSAIYAFSAVTVAIFFYVFQKQQG